MKRNVWGLCLAFVVMFATSPVSFAQPNPKALQEWKDQKYTMFIHWGLYAELGGVWEGKPVTKGLSEQIQAHAGIYSDTYAAVANEFNPVNWNPDSIAILAKRARMRAIVLTSKHHDGFCMWNTATTDFDVVDATPYGKDVIKGLAEACQRQGLQFGLYFSLIDWHFPEAAPISSHNSDPVTPALHAYNKKQLTELLTNYGPISELWFDMGSQTAQQSRELKELVHTLQPNCMIGSRIGNDQGDFTVMSDNQEPDYTVGVPWQAPASFFDETWGYRSWQTLVPEKEKVHEKLASLIRTASRGGKFLLNIGPKGDGSVVPYERDVLLKMGKWLEKNKEAIYGTNPDPFQVSFEWGSITSRPGKLYLHVLSPPKDGAIVLPGLSGKIKKVYVLGEEKKKGSSGVTPEGVTISLPKGLDLAQEYKVVVVAFADGYTIKPAHSITSQGDSIILSSANAFKHYSNSGIDYNSRFRSTVKESWTVEAQQSGTYTPTLYYSEEEKGTQIDLEVNGRQTAVTLDNAEPVKLTTDPGSMGWGDIYVAGPFTSGIEGIKGPVKDIDVTAPWPNDSAKVWTHNATWQNNNTYTLPAGLTTSYFVLQEITSDKAQPFLVRITSGDGVLVLLNGEQLLVNNNPQKKASMQHVVLLPLKPGKNQLLVKVFNNFQKSITWSVDTNVAQVLYRKPLPPVQLQRGQHYAYSWQLHRPASAHQTLKLPNVSLRLVKE